MRRALAGVTWVLVGTAGCGNAAGRSPDRAGAPGSQPVLVPGVWTNNSPPAPLRSEELGGRPSGGVISVALDPTAPLTLYASVEYTGVWKTTDGGSSWEQLADTPDEDLYDAKTFQLELPLGIAVDPADPSHLYAVSGVRDANNGFWISNDGGRSWAIPQGFKDVSPTYDITTLVVDPTDFGHILLGSHSFDNVGVLESRDFGSSWIWHPPPDSTWPGGSYGLAMLYNPELGIGDSNTWLAHHNGFWLTKDAGTSWTQVNSEINGVHGSTEVYYSKTGMLYSGAGNGLARSNDNGTTWELINQGLPSAPFNTIVGDSNTMYTQPGLADGTCQTLVSSETDGETWVQYQGGTQPVRTGSYRMRFDPTNRILYSANGGAGLYALKVLDP